MPKQHEDAKLTDVKYHDEPLVTKSQWKDILQKNEMTHELDISNCRLYFSINITISLTFYSSKLRGVSSVYESINFDLLGSPWISTIQKYDWDNALEKSTVRQYKKKDFIIQSGEIIECLYYLKKGRIKTVAISPSGQQKIMWYINSCCIFGETPFFNQKP